MDVAAAIKKIHVWLHTEGMDCDGQESFTDGYVDVIREAGVPVDRFFCGEKLLHPLLVGKYWKWMDGVLTSASWTKAQNEAYEKENEGWETKDRKEMAPVVRLILGEPSVTLKVGEDFIPKDCSWMESEGFTELYGLPSPNTGNKQFEGTFTWSTRQPGGFTDEHLEVIKETVLSLSTLVRHLIQRDTGKMLLCLYLGEDAGSRVFRGDIERGEGLVIRAAIWFSDIRGFTAMSNRLPREELVDVINSTMQVTADTIREHGGQTLKMMGDGLMAIFTSAATSFQRDSLRADEKRSVDDQMGPKVCQQARLAADKLQKRLEQLSDERSTKGLTPISVGIGLHYGDVSYGNIGAPERLDFTVLGPAVNLASRTESLTSKLSCKVLCTESFRSLDASDRWKPRGGHLVKGVPDPVDVFELLDDHSSEKQQVGESTFQAEDWVEAVVGSLSRKSV